jgi:hypothetical protein
MSGILAIDERGDTTHAYEDLFTACKLPPMEEILHLLVTSPTIYIYFSKILLKKLNQYIVPVVV